MSGLVGKIAWITGGGSGIGEAGAKVLAAAGAHVIVSGRRSEALNHVVERIVASGGTAEAAVVDVADEAQVRSVADSIIANHGGIDILVASAGVNVPNRSFAAPRFGKLDDADRRQSEWDDVCHPVRAARHARPA